MNRSLTTAVLFAVFVLPLYGQMGAPSTGGLGSSVGTSGFNSPRGTPGVSSTVDLNRSMGHPFNRGRNRVFFRNSTGQTVFLPYWYSEDYRSSEVVIENIGPAIPAQQQRVTAPVYEEHKPEAPLIIEKEGDLWVRRRVVETDEHSTLGPQEQYVSAQPLPRTRQRVNSPAVLVFRDGQTVDVSNYVIAGNVVYESTPQWTRKILLADLDIPATMKLNRSRGIDFRVPGALNQVVTYP